MATRRKSVNVKKQAEEVEDLIYEVEEIVDKRVVRVDGKKKVQYLIKWTGYPDSENTWEDEQNLECESLKKQFDERYDVSKRSKRKATTSQTQKENGALSKSDFDSMNVDKILPFLGSWEKEVKDIDSVESSSDGEIFVWIVWTDGRKERFPGYVVKTYCPLKLLNYYERYIHFVDE